MPNDYVLTPSAQHALCSARRCWPLWWRYCLRDYWRHDVEELAHRGLVIDGPQTPVYLTKAGVTRLRLQRLPLRGR